MSLQARSLWCQMYTRQLKLPNCIRTQYIVCFLSNNPPFICKLYIDYDCPEKADHEYTKVDDNVNANVEFLGESVGRPASSCRDDCDKKDTCDFFMFNYHKHRCIMWRFIRPSKVLQVGLTKDAIFCMKQSKYT